MLPGVAEFVVQGVTVEGELCQPPEWAQQLCNTLAATGTEGLPYSSYVRPVMVDGVAAVVVRVSLQLADEQAFEKIRRFVAEHRLLVRAGRGSRDAESTGAHPVYVPERRSAENNNW
ncbi:MAG: DUF3579 domain-containing protein [Nitrosomonadales bacterium]|nr:DUF3579 domain-containing protein [Nitrosomonadales bacterium]